MGAKCSKEPDFQNHDRYRGSSRHGKNSRGPPAPELRSPSRPGRRMFAEASSLGATPPRPVEEDGGWGMKFADMRSQELLPTGPEYRTKDPKRKRNLTKVLSSKAPSVRTISNVAKKGALKVSEVLRGAGSVGLGALDTISSSVAHLNSRGGFAAGAVAKGHKIGILAFEVANTIVKGCKLKMTLAEEDMKMLKEDVLVSEGVQRLVSNNPDELMLIAATDKRNELKVFTDEVVRFGNHCKDPQWHNYDLFFQRLFKDMEILRLSSEQAEKIMDDLMTLAQNTADLYHELHALDRFRTDLKRKQQEEQSAGANARGGETVALLKSEVKSQEKHVERLKKRSLWSRTLEEVMEQLVYSAIFLYQEIDDHFGPQVFLESPNEEKKRNAGKLGPTGLSLHYANLINQIDTLVQRPGSVPPNTRDNLYQGLPPSVKGSLRARLQGTQNGRQRSFTLNTAELKDELDKLLSWLVPVASNTTKAHHGFGWVGEWANTGSPADRRAMGYVDVSLIQTLHHANQQKVEKYILELIVGLHHLVSMAKANLHSSSSNPNYTIYLNNTNTNTNIVNNINKNTNNNVITNTNRNININTNIINNNNNNNMNINRNTNMSMNSQTRSPQNKSPSRIHVKPAMEQPFVPSDRSVSPPPFGMFSNTEYTEGLPQQQYARKELSQEDKEILHNVGSDYSARSLLPGLSKSQEFDNTRAGAHVKDYRKTSSHSQASSQQAQDPPLYRPRNRIKTVGIRAHGLDERDQSPEHPPQSHQP